MTLLVSLQKVSTWILTVKAPIFQFIYAMQRGVVLCGVRHMLAAAFGTIRVSVKFSFPIMFVSCVIGVSMAVRVFVV